MSNHSECGFSIFQDCNCGGECKSATIPLGRFTKNDAMRGVFLPRFTDYLALIAFCALSIAIGLTTYTLLQNERQYQIEARI
jgi:hypothetical protein